MPLLTHTRTLLVLLLLLFAPALSRASGEADPKRPAPEAKAPAILLVSFGTSVPSAQTAFTHIEQQVRAVFPGTEIRWAYTSKIIRKKLAKGGAMIDSPEMALARLLEDGYTRVAVQSLHMIPGAEFHEIQTNARLFQQMVGGFDRVQVSLPLLSGDESMDKLVDILLARIVPKERKPKEAVLFMGHGTHHPSDAIYSALQYRLSQKDPNVFIGTVSGRPSFEEAKDALMKKKIKKVYLIPLMTVAGEHARKDMAGEEPESWKNQLAKAGVDSVPLFQGLAEFDPVVDLWLDNLKVAMARLQ